MKRFIGEWALEHWRSGDHEPFGPRPRGTLVYTAAGTMIACFMRGERAPVAATLAELAAWRRYWRDATGDEETRRRFLEAALAFNAYCGRYTVDGEHIHHDVEVALFPEWVGTRMTRRFSFEANRLTLGFGVDSLVWSRRGDADTAL